MVDVNLCHVTLSREVNDEEIKYSERHLIVQKTLSSLRFTFQNGPFSLLF
jgi:hypothetical protein